MQNSFYEWCQCQPEGAELLKEWDLERNVAKEITPATITYGSAFKVFWKCSLGHTWEAPVYRRTTQHTKCPYCANNKVWPGFNDLETTHPDIAKQWHTTKNGSLTPQMVLAGSGKQVWWKCNRGHEWKIDVNSRKKGSGCPICAKAFTSLYEDALVFYLAPMYPGVIKGFKPEWLKTVNMELDIYIPELKLAIEHDGWPWHMDKRNDLRKDFLCQKNGVKMLRIRDDRNPPLEGGSSVCLMYTCSKERFDTIERVVRIVLEFLSQPIPDIDIKRDLEKIEDIRWEWEYKRSLEANYPELMREWDYERNEGINPGMIRVHSCLKAWWKCKLGHSWQARVFDRTNGNVCPYCNNKQVLVGFNDLATTCPQVLPYWDYKKTRT